MAEDARRLAGTDVLVEILWKTVFHEGGKITLESCGNLLNGNYRLWLIEFKLNSISSIAAN